MLNATSGAALLARHLGRMQAFFEKPRLIDDEYSLGIAHMLDQRGP